MNNEGQELYVNHTITHFSYKTNGLTRTSVCFNCHSLKQETGSVFQLPVSPSPLSSRELDYKLKAQII